MDHALRAEISAIAADSRSGATAILSRAVGVLRAAAGDRAALEEAAGELCRAQPSMAGLRVAAAVALRASDPARALDTFAARVDRAPQHIARYTVDLLKLRRSSGPLRIVTISRSQTVEQALLALAREVRLEVCCAESRPALEGRDLASALAGRGVRVKLYTDAAIASALRDSEAFLTGADAIGTDAFINKVGTAALAALAGALGVPAYVLSGREKIVPDEVFAALSLAHGTADEVWGGAPGDVQVRNPYFEQIPSFLIAAFITDAGPLSSSSITEAII